MPELERPDGARIHYEVRGEGPLVVLTLGFAASPAIYEGLVTDLARDHRVVTWDPRGCGSSSPEGPYDIATDAGDLLAVIRELGPPATVFAVGHGSLVAPRARTLDPDAISAMVSPALVVALRRHLGETEGFGSSETVVQMLVEQFRRDPRASARATIASLNPQYDEDQVRARVDETVAYAPAETTLPRIEAWLEEEDALDDLRGFGDRLAVLWYAGDPWQAGSVPRAQELLPEARVIELEDGTLSRPDLAANVVREMS